ncbi:MAG: glycosyltransferase family 4 protein [bacterium]|nr:glycosyltransferase family 4 protein [bacterium]
MKIIMLTQWCYPEPGPRVHELAAALLKKGHKVTIITGFPTVPYTHFYKEYRLSLWRWDKYENVDILRLLHFPHGGKSPIKRILHYASFMISVIIIGNIFVKKADCMYVFLPPPTTGIAAWGLKLFHNIPLVYDIQDIWPEAVMASGMVKSKSFINLLAGIENFIYPKAAGISVPSSGYKKNLIKKGVPSEKIAVIPNWADENIYKPAAYNDKLAERLGMKNKFNILFAGNLGLAQGLETIILSAELLVDLNDIQFVFAGDGVEEERLKSLCKIKGLGNVLFLGRFPAKDISDICAIADVLLVHLKRDPLFNLTVPSKTISYMACGKPILMAVEGDASDLILSSAAGIVCPSDNSKELSSAVRKFKNTSKAERELMGKSAREYFLKNFTLDIVSSKFEQLFINIVKNKE